jgi:hypothetical protein
MYLFRDENAELPDWWNKNRARPLWEIQCDAIDHAIRFMKSVKRDEVRPPFGGAERLPLKKFEALRSENLRILERMKTSIQAVKKPYRPASLEGDIVSMFLLPWPARTIAP